MAKFRKNILLLLLLIPFATDANMASPVLEGSFSSSPFIGNYVDITYEKIHIIPDRGFKTAKFVVEYYIEAKKSGLQIPLLFYAAGLRNGFEVKIDGKNVALQQVPQNYNPHGGVPYYEFMQFYQRKPWQNYDGVFEAELEDGEFNTNVLFNELQFFYVDIPKGSHIIEVNYTADHWIVRDHWLNTYSFRYALSPAKYWRSYGGLEVTLDNTAAHKAITTNLGVPESGNLKTTAVWKFDTLPAAYIIIEDKPKISVVAESLITIGPGLMAFALSVILVTLHIIFIKKYRRRHISKKYSTVVIAGSVILPFICLYLYLVMYSVIDYFIGEAYASHYHGYIFLIFIFYPFLVVIYWLVMWLLDWLLKKRLKLVNK
ncbi:exosortase/archaeosortase family protein [Flavobacterium rhizosphaerae]|uniref:Exosortase/archaeosortase family protein n=1 Tax=Flavobacterium rhizosphaerae TaxID=3163298 RepID=A0ABW8YT31_9FLAO